jgi:hypothetical protein
VLTASFDKTARLWPVLPTGIPPPDWYSDFLVWLGAKRIAPDGQIETLSEDALLKLEARLRPHMNDDTDYAHLLRWRLLTATERPVDPYDTTTQAQAADLIIRPEMNKYEAEHAYDLDPWHPLVHLALAGFEEDPIRADFLRRYSIGRLPDDPKVRQRAAEFLRKQKERRIWRGKWKLGGNKGDTSRKEEIYVRSRLRCAAPSMASVEPQPCKSLICIERRSPKRSPPLTR